MFRNIKLAAVAAVFAASPALAEYPEREVLGVVMWGAGGATATDSTGLW